MDTQYAQHPHSDADIPADDRNQRKRTLTVILVVVMLATSLFGAVNLFFYEANEPALVFFATSALCLPAFWLNHRGHYLAAGASVAVLVLIASHYNLVDGAGLDDPGIAAYPILIIIGGLLFGKRAIPLFAIVSIASLIVVVLVQSSFAADIDRLVITSILLLAAAGTTWAIMENMEKHLAQIKQSEIDLRQAYEQTQAQARQVRRIIETVPEGVLLLNAERRIILANLAAQNFLNILSPFSDKDSPFKQVGETPLEKILDQTGDGRWQEIRVADPAEYIFEVAARPVQRESASSRDWVLVLRDVTRQRKQQEAMQEQERLATVGQLASGIAHDFKNILSVISTYSQILQAKPDAPKRDEYLTVIQNQSQDAAHLIEKILDFSRRSVMERKVIDAVELVDELVSLLRPMMPANISIQFEHNQGNYYINADKAWLQQALMNLAVNARDAMPNGGQLQFTLSAKQPKAESIPTPKKRDTWLCLQVSDSGQGIQKADLPHVFEPFYTKKEAGKGTGLGLAQVYGIVKQHGGEITVQSTWGKGTTFDLYFPTVSDPT